MSDFRIRGSLTFNTSDFTRGIQGVRRQMSDLRGDNVKTAASERQLAFEVRNLNRALERQSRQIGLLTLQFVAFRNALRTVALRVAITGFASLAAVVSSLAGGLVVATTSLGAFGAALGVAGGVGLLSLIQGIGVASLGLNDLGKALTTTGKAHEKAMAKLTKPARAFAKELGGLRDGFREIKLLAQQGMFPGLLRGLKALKPLGDVLKQVVYDTAKIIGYLGQGFGELFGGRAGDVERLGERYAVTFRRIGDSALNIVEALIDVFRAAEPLIGHISRGIVTFTEGLKDAAAEGRKSGGLASFFWELRKSWDEWTSIIGNTFRLIRGVMRAALPATHEFNTSINDTLIAWTKWVNDAKGQATLRKFFSNSNKVLGSMARFTGEVVATFARLSFKGSGNAIGFFDLLANDLLPLIERVASRLNEDVFPTFMHIGEQVFGFINRVLPAVQAMTGAIVVLWKTIGNALEAITEVTGKMPKIQGAFAALALGAGVLFGWQKLKLAISAVILQLRMMLGLAERMAVMRPGMSMMGTGLGRNGEQQGGGVAPMVGYGGRGGGGGGAGQRGGAPAIRYGFPSLNQRTITESRGGMRGGLPRTTGQTVRYDPLSRVSRGAYAPQATGVPYGPMPRVYGAAAQSWMRARTVVGPARWSRPYPISDVTRNYNPPIAWNQTRQRPGSVRRVQFQRFPIPGEQVPMGARSPNRSYISRTERYRQATSIVPPRTGRVERFAGNTAGLARTATVGTAQGIAAGFKKSAPIMKAAFGIAAFSGIIGGLSSNAKTIGGRFTDALSAATFGLAESTTEQMEKAGKRGSEAFRRAFSGNGQVQIFGKGSLTGGDQKAVIAAYEALKKAQGGVKPTTNPLSLTKPGDVAKLNAVVEALRKAGKISDETADSFRKMGRAFTDRVTKIGPEAAKLKGFIASGLDFGGVSARAVTELDEIKRAFALLANGGGKNLKELRATVATNTAVIARVLGKDTESGKLALAKNFREAAAAVRVQMRNGTVSVKTGTAQINEYLIKAVMALGFSNKEQAQRIVNGKDSLTGKTPTGGTTRTNAARGMLARLPGGVGPDSLPLNVNGRQILAAPGEDVAVINRHQRRVLDHRLGDMGGLNGLFRRVNTPHNHPAGFVRGGMVTASKYGGSDDPSAYGKTTAGGQTANNGLRGYAELSNNYGAPISQLDFAALGKLPMGTQLQITYNGRTTVAPKVDVGAGGPGLGGYKRAIDLAAGTAGDIGFPGLANVTVADAGQGSGGGGLDVGGAAGAAISKVAPKIKRIVQKGISGLLGATVQGSLDRAQQAAQKRVDAIAAQMGGSPSVGSFEDAPSQVRAMAAFASRLDSMDIPYGPQGHGGPSINTMGEDCSSSVSKVLMAGGGLRGVDTTVTMGAHLESGRGKYITVHNRPLAGDAGHMIMEFPGGRFFGTSRQNPKGGPGYFPAPDAGYLASMPQKLHPKGLARGGVVYDAKSKSKDVGTFPVSTHPWPKLEKLTRRAAAKMREMTGATGASPKLIVGGNDRDTDGQYVPDENDRGLGPGRIFLSPGVARALVSNNPEKVYRGTAQKVLAHELAHSYQHLLNRTESEGGAELWAMRHTRELMNGIDLGYMSGARNVYPRERAWVLDHYGPEWIDHGQFGVRPKNAGPSEVRSALRASMPSRGGGTPKVNTDDAIPLAERGDRDARGKKKAAKTKAAAKKKAKKKKRSRVGGASFPKLATLVRAKKKPAAKAFASSYAKLLDIKTGDIPPGTFTDYAKKFGVPMTLRENELTALQGLHGLSEEEPIVSLYDSDQFPDLSNWLKAHPSDPQDVDSLDVVNRSGMFVQGKFIRGIDQAVAELRAQYEIYTRGGGDNEYDRNDGILGLLFAQEGNLLGLDMPKAERLRDDETEALQMIRDFWETEHARHEAAVVGLRALRSGTISWQDRVATNDENIERLEDWKRRSRVKVAGKSTTTAYKQLVAKANKKIAELRKDSEKLREEKPAAKRPLPKKATKAQKAAYARQEEARRKAGVRITKLRDDSRQEMQYLAGDNLDKFTTDGGVAALHKERRENLKGVLEEFRESLRDTMTSIAPSRKLEAATLWQQMKDLGATSVPPLPKSETSTTSQTAEALAETNRQIAEQNAAAFRISQDQFAVFKGFEPLVGQRLVGAFAHGGVVPETGMALVHKNETIVPDIDGPYANRVAAMSGGAGGPTNIEVHLNGSMAALHAAIDARIDSRAPVVVSKVLGRRARTIGAAPGGR